MKAINDLKLIGALTAAPTLQRRRGFDVMEGTVAMKTDVNGRTLTTYVPFVVMGTPARNLHARVGSGSIVSLSGVARQERWGEKNERVRFMVLRAEVIGATGAAPEGQSAVGGKNSVTIGGNLTAAPVARTVTVGGEKVLVADFSVALNETYESGGSRARRVSYVNVTAWRATADFALTLAKGQAVTIDGAVVGERFTDKNGQKRSTLRFEAVSIFPVETPPALEGPAAKKGEQLPMASD